MAEDYKVPNEDKEMEIFTRLQQKLDKVKNYRNNNQKRLIILKEEMRKVRDHMEDVNRQQNLAIHKVITGRRKT
ncbi:hypothetical protein SteCoe_32664 [Stentor coeruleus]|uniref:Uncharacterized protein n=1 Tax=Stentor coeruleus TaxID=5963 RepID=A0A1R2AYP4_9CILI|nr:hypothetical protein SteCoe_32664 [Stentor coeruleus]